MLIKSKSNICRFQYGSQTFYAITDKPFDSGRIPNIQFARAVSGVRYVYHRPNNLPAVIFEEGTYHYYENGLFKSVVRP